MLSAKHKEKVAIYIANLVEQKKDILLTLIQQPELELSTTRKNTQRIKAIPKQSADVDKASLIIQLTKTLNLDLKHLMSFLTKLALGQKTTQLIELIRLDITNVGIFVGLMYRNKQLIAYPEITGREKW